MKAEANFRLIDFKFTNSENYQINNFFLISNKSSVKMNLFIGHFASIDNVTNESNNNSLTKNIYFEKKNYEMVDFKKKM